MITGIPDYGSLPIEYSLRCVCSRRYLIYAGMGRIISDAESRACERAGQTFSFLGPSVIALFSLQFRFCSGFLFHF
jgi:hypothetical protein